MFTRAPVPRRVAALDIRSNSVHLSVADVAAGSVRPVAHAKERIQLGRDVFSSSRPSDETLSRATAALRRLVALANKSAADEIVATASPAFRHTHAGAFLLHEAEKVIGASIRVLDSDEQARLLLSGVRSCLPSDERLAVVDLGGASAEIVLAAGSRVSLSACLPIGTLRLRGALGTRSLPDARGIVEIQQYVTRCVASTVQHMRHAGFDRLVLSCGVARRLWRLAEPTRKRGASLPPGGEARLTAAELDRLVSRLKGMTEKGRTFAIGAAEGPDTLLTGAIVLATLMRLLGVEEATVSTAGMREGVVRELLEG